MYAEAGAVYVGVCTCLCQCSLYRAEATLRTCSKKYTRRSLCACYDLDGDGIECVGDGTGVCVRVCDSLALMAMAL